MTTASRTSAQEEALIAHLRSRGLVAPTALESANAERGAQPLVQLLTRRGLLSPADLGRLLGELQGYTFACACRSWRYAELAPLPGLGCPSCHAPLVAAQQPTRQGPPTTGRLPAVPAGLPLAHERALGPYELLRELGRGTMGVVFLARRGPDGPPVALKVILEEAADEEGRIRFQREASIALRLDHPGIVRALDVGRAGGRGYYAMEFVEGKSLHQHLAGGPLEPREAASILARVARAVEAAHAQGVIHRDLKPANIMLADPDGTPRITDFGLARDEAMSRSLTRTGAMLGTPLTMSPEQIRGEKIDLRADVYALGAVLYRCLTGHFPFEAATPVELARAVLDDVPVLPSAHRPGLPSALDEVTLRALSRDRRDRYASAGAFAEALEAWLAAQGRPRRSGRQARGLLAPPGGAHGPPRALLVGAAVVAVLAASAAGVAFGLRGRAGVAAVSSAPPPPPATTSPPPVAASPVTEPAPRPGTDEPRAAPAPARPLDPRLEKGERYLVEMLTGGTEQEKAARASYCLKLLDELPDDPHAQVIGGFTALAAGLRVRQSDLRRTVIAVGPRMGPDARILCALFCFEMGFQRAALDLARSVLGPGDEVPSVWAGHLLVMLLVKAPPPLRDAARAAALEPKVLAAWAREQPAPIGRTSIILMGATARLVNGDRDGAVTSLRAGARAATSDEEASAMTARADSIEAGAIGPEELIRAIPARLSVGEYLARLAAYEDAPGATDRTLAQSLRLDALAPSEHDGWGGHGGRSGRRAGYNALTLLHAARAWVRAGEEREALADLERAWKLVEATDVEDNGDIIRVVAIELARAQLEANPAEAVRLADIATRPWPAAELDLRTSGERADAWVVLARARLACGERDKARHALAVAEAAAPYDRRELEALAAELAR